MRYGSSGIDTKEGNRNALTCPTMLGALSLQHGRILVEVSGRPPLSMRPLTMTPKRLGTTISGHASPGLLIHHHPVLEGLVVSDDTAAVFQCYSFQGKFSNFVFKPLFYVSLLSANLPTVKSS